MILKLLKFSKKKQLYNTNLNFKNSSRINELNLNSQRINKI